MKMESFKSRWKNKNGRTSKSRSENEGASSHGSGSENEYTNVRRVNKIIKIEAPLKV